MIKSTTILTEDDTQTNPPAICYYPGGFKPPHEGHFEAAKYLASLTYVTKVIVLIGHKERDGITKEMSKDIWDLYLQKHPMAKITVRISEDASPIKDIFSIMNDDLQLKAYVAGAKDEVEDQQYFEGLVKAFSTRIMPITVEDKLITQGKRLSGTQVRDLIIKLKQSVSKISTINDKNSTEYAKAKNEYLNTFETLKGCFPEGVIQKGDFENILNILGIPVLEIDTLQEVELQNITIKNKKLYHSTDLKFDTFSLEHIWDGFWFTNNINSIKNQTLGASGGKYIITRCITLDKPAGWDEYDKYSVGELINMGYDGVILPEDDRIDYLVFSPKSIEICKDLKEELFSIKWWKQNLKEHEDNTKDNIIQDFVNFAINTLELNKVPKITFADDETQSKQMHSLGAYNPETNELLVVKGSRLIADILRTIGHEFSHCKQAELGQLNPNSGETGSPEENEANASAGILMRLYSKQHPEIFETLKEEIENKYKIYCDMDGVLVDFERGYKELTGQDIHNNFSNNKDFWEPLTKAGAAFWIKLKWMSDGKQLWDYINKYNPELLSSPSYDESSKIGKHVWVKREIPGTKLILRSVERKPEFATPNSILIDDRADTIQRWKDAGGIGIHHTSAENTITQLQNLGL